MIEAGEDALMGDERFGEGKPRREVGRGKKRDARFLAAAKRLIEAMKHGFGRFREWNRRSSDARGRS